MKLVLDMLYEVGLRAHPDKSLFGCTTVENLGFNVSATGLTPHAAKTAAIMELPEPTSVKGI